MYLRILKKDFVKKRVMNTILLLFVVLATTFTVSSVNNIITLMNSREDFTESSGYGKGEAQYNYFALCRKVQSTPTRFADLAGDKKNVSSYSSEQMIMLSDNEIKLNGEAIKCISACISPFEQIVTTIFDENNQPIECVESGTIYIPAKLRLENDIKKGDMLTIAVGGTTKRLRVTGYCKDLLFGSKSVGVKRLVISQKDYESFGEVEQSRINELYHLCVKNIPAFETALAESGIASGLSGSVKLIMYVYILDMIIGAVFLIISAILILISFVILRFTITHTISEEYREIGMMKAIGVNDRKVKSLYLLKYFAIAAVGATVGFFLSVPFGSFLLKRSSDILLVRSRLPIGVNIAIAAVVVLVVMLYCSRCTSLVSRLTPIDAIRSGTKGERFRARSPISLSRGHQKPLSFLAVNDILSSTRKFFIMALTFMLALLSILMLKNVQAIFESDDIAEGFGLMQSDAFIEDENSEKLTFTGSRDIIMDDIERVTSKLADNGIEAKCWMEAEFRIKMAHGDRSYAALICQGMGNSAADYVYTQGTAPSRPNEIAITGMISEKLNLHIGDSVYIYNMGKPERFIVTAMYQSMMNMGDGVRLHEDADIDCRQLLQLFPYQVLFTDAHTEEQCAEYMAKLRDIYSDEGVITCADYVESFSGVGSSLKSTGRLLIPVMIMICVLVAVLMEYSFIADEVGEIAQLKAIGFRSSLIIGRHTLRMALTMLFALVVIIPLSQPITKLCLEPVFKMMGADCIVFSGNTLGVHIVYPLIMFAATITAIYITAQATRRITASQTANIE